MAKSLFVNAIKAIRQGQPELLDLFLKKHPEIATAKGPVEREGGTKVRLLLALHRTKGFADGALVWSMKP